MGGKNWIEIQPILANGPICIQFSTKTWLKLLEMVYLLLLFADDSEIMLKIAHILSEYSYTEYLY